MRLLRYADVLLIYAEAMAQGASIQSESGYSAADALNEVRQRAGLAPAAADLQTIWDERRAELAMEENCPRSSRIQDRQERSVPYTGNSDSGQYRSFTDTWIYILKFNHFIHTIY